jgi:hypothetical protein
MVEIILKGVVFGQTPEVAVLDGLEIINCGSANAHHFGFLILFI